MGVGGLFVGGLVAVPPAAVVGLQKPRRRTSGAGARDDVAAVEARHGLDDTHGAAIDLAGPHTGIGVDGDADQIGPAVGERLLDQHVEPVGVARDFEDSAQRSLLVDARPVIVADQITHGALGSVAGRWVIGNSAV